MKEFGGKVAVVTGGGQGIGRALVERFTDEGMKVVLADVVPALVEQTTGELRDQGRDVVGVVTDVTSLESVEALRDATLDAFGAVHVVCNNAGIGSGSEGQIWEHHVNDWRWSLDVNVMGVVNGINAFVPTMLAQRRGGARRQHDVGQRRVHAADQQRGLRHHQGRGHDHHRVPLGSAARDRREGRRVVALPVDAHARDAQHRHLAARARTAPTATTDRARRRRKAATRSASTNDAWTPPACRSCSRRSSEVADLCFEGIRDDVFWITYPSEPQQAKIRARAESQMAMTPPDYLLEAHMMAAKPADRE